VVVRNPSNALFTNTAPARGAHLDRKITLHRAARVDGKSRPDASFRKRRILREVPPAARLNLKICASRSAQRY
jgi:hypothetical protein